MQELSLKTKLIKYLEISNRWINKSDLEGYSKELGFLAENGSRRLRELYQAGLIERRLNEHGVAEYRSKQAERDIFGFEIPRNTEKRVFHEKPKSVVDDNRLRLVDGRLMVRF